MKSIFLTPNRFIDKHRPTLKGMIFILTEEAKNERREYMRRWREKNRLSVREYSRNWRRNNREAMNQYAKAWRDANPDKVKAYREAYWERKSHGKDDAE